MGQRDRGALLPDRGGRPLSHFWKRALLAAAAALAASCLFLAGLLLATFRRRPPAPAPARHAPGPPLFLDAAEAAGVSFRDFRGRRSALLPEDNGSGVCFVDVDGDGRDDLFFVNAAPLDPAKREGKSPNALFLNRGNGTFAAARAPAGLKTGAGCLFFDAEGNGRRDLFLTGYEGTRFYRSLPGGRFADETAASGLADRRWSTGACAADYDGDGRVDIYFPRYVDYRRGRKSAAAGRNAYRAGIYWFPLSLNPYAFPPLDSSLYHNEGAGRFKDATASSGTRNKKGKANQCLFADLDQDGRPDLYVASDAAPDRLFRNLGNGKFADVTNAAWLGGVKISMGIAVGDFDGDGDDDLLVSQWLTQAKSLYVNLLRERGSRDAPGRRLHFTDGTAAAGLGESTRDNMGWGVAFLDYDNDGRLDIIIANGSLLQDRDNPANLVPQRLQLFHNEGGGGFKDVSWEAGPAFNAPINGRGLAVADYDRDGRLDMTVNVYGGKALLLRNAIKNGNHWLELWLHGRRPNTDAIGARVLVTTPDGRTQTRLVTAGGSYLSQNSFLVHFGLGAHAKAARAEVVWPSGRRQVLRDLAADRLVEISELGGIPHSRH